MENLIQEWPGYVLSRYDQQTKTWMFIAIYATAMGAAGGGTRMKHYATPGDGLQDAMRLARAMNNKFVLSDLPYDGAKAVLAIPSDFDPAQREGLFTRYGKWLNRLNAIFYTGGDFGTTQDDMIVISRHHKGVGGLPPEMGGSGDLGKPTALGVYCGIEAACEHHFGTADLSGRSVLVQGVGVVGHHLVDMLLEAGCTVMFSDISPVQIKHFRDELGLTYIEPDAVYSQSCDIFAPCATGQILNSRTIPQLQASIIVGSANNQLEQLEDGEALHERGILYAPDYIVNAGAAIYDVVLRNRGETATSTELRVRKIGDTLREVLGRAKDAGISPSKMAEKIADERNAERNHNM